MKNDRIAFLLAFAATSSAQGTVTLAGSPQSIARFLADVQRRLLGRRFSPLTKIDTATISSMTLAWVYRPNPGNVAAGGGGQTVVTIKGTPVVANGVMCVSIPDHVWAVDARSGRELWHATWPSKGGGTSATAASPCSAERSMSRPRTATSWRSTAATGVKVA